MPEFGFRFYDFFLFCSKCQTWVPHKRAAKDKRGRLICPKCKKTLRTHPRYNPELYLKHKARNRNLG